MLRSFGCSGPPNRHAEIGSGTKHRRLRGEFSGREPDRDYLALGIYERSGDRLKIEFAKPGQPCPTEFSPDPATLPEGLLLLLFERATKKEDK